MGCCSEETSRRLTYYLLLYDGYYFRCAVSSSSGTFIIIMHVIMRDSVVRLLVLEILVSLVVLFCDRLWYSETDVVSEYSYDHAHCRLLYLYDIIFYPCAVRCYRLWKRFYNHNSWFLDTYHSVIDWCPFSAGLQVVLGHRGRRVVSFGIRALVR